MKLNTNNPAFKGVIVASNVKIPPNMINIRLQDCDSANMGNHQSNILTIANIGEGANERDKRALETLDRLDINNLIYVKRPISSKKEAESIIGDILFSNLISGFRGRHSTMNIDPDTFCRD